MAIKPEGIFPCTVISASFGQDDKNSPQVQINVRIDEGAAAGQLCTYEDQVNAKSALYVGRSCKAVGWSGKDLNTLADDCAKWVTATGGKSTVEIKHLEIRTGRRAGQIWDKVNSIGRGSRKLAAASGELLDDANQAMRDAMAADAAGGGDGDGDIPFASCDITLDVNPVARVLR